MKELSFDHVYHLAGDQVIPNYIGVKLCEATTHHLVVTEKTASTIAALDAGLSNNQSQTIQTVRVSATDYEAILKALQRSVSELPPGTRIGFNITGGTKPMSAAALDLCRRHQIAPFYIDTQERKIRFFVEPFYHLEMPPGFNTVASFLPLAGYQVKIPGTDPQELLTPARGSLLKALWKQRNGVQRFQNDFAKAADNHSDSRPPDEYWRALDGLMSFATSKDSYLEECWNRNFPDAEHRWREIARFAAGIWLEEWMVLQLNDSRKNENILDLQQGIHICAHADARKETDIQNIDVAFTDGYTLTLIECKCGRYDQSNVQKLENLRTSLGGAFGKAILAAINEPEQILSERIRLGSIALVCGHALQALADNLDHVQPKRIYQRAEDFG